jgi:hypothetical protein
LVAQNLWTLQLCIWMGTPTMQQQQKPAWDPFHLNLSLI